MSRRCPASSVEGVASSPFTRRRSTMMRRCRLQPFNRTCVSLACQPDPIDPLAVLKKTLDRASDVRGQPQLEQIRQRAELGLAHDLLVAESLVAAQQSWPTIPRCPIQQRPQSRCGVMGRVLIPRAHIHVEDQSRARHRVSVIAMARSTGLLRIVAHHRSFLTAVERLHRRIDVENPGSLKSGSRQWSRCRRIHAAPASSSIAAKARRTESSLTIFLMPRSSGRTPSPRNAAI